MGIWIHVVKRVKPNNIEYIIHKDTVYATLAFCNSNLKKIIRIYFPWNLIRYLSTIAMLMDS